MDPNYDTMAAYLEAKRKAEELKKRKKRAAEKALGNDNPEDLEVAGAEPMI
jgi:hypothetical protein